jgi:hypothetical protein
MKRLLLTMMLIGGALLSTQAQGRRDYGRNDRGHGYGYGHGPRYEREYRRDDCYRGPREHVYRGGYGGYCAPAPVVYAAPCPPPPPPPVRVVYPRGPRVVVAAGPIVVGF